MIPLQVLLYVILRDELEFSFDGWSKLFHVKVLI